MKKTGAVELSIIDIKEYFNVEDGEEDGGWQDTLRFEESGIYFKEIKGASDLSPEEYESIYGTIRNFDRPILSLPCGLEEFENFVQIHGLYGAIDPFTLAWSLLKKEKNIERSKLDRRMSSILIEIENQGLDSLALPPYGPRRPGPKADIKKILIKNPLFTAKGFETAWEKLSQKELIRYSK